MKRLSMVISLIFLCCFTVGCEQEEKVAAVDVKEDIQTIKDIVSECNAAFNAADVDGVVSFYSDDAVRIAPNEIAVIGREAIRTKVQDMLDSLILQEQWTVDNVQFSGNSAITLLSFSAEGRPKAGGELFKTNGSWIMIFEHDSGDVWKCAYSIWSDVSLIHQD